MDTYIHDVSLSCNNFTCPGNRRAFITLALLHSISIPRNEGLEKCTFAECIKKSVNTHGNEEIQS